MNLCKIWALKKNYCLMSYIHNNGSYDSKYSVCEVLKPIYGSSALFDELYKISADKLEYNAVFKAVEWIIKNNNID